MSSIALFLDLLVAALPMVTSDSACPTTKSIETHLATLLNPATTRPGRAFVEDRQDQLIIRLQLDGARDAERTIAVDGTCDDRGMAAAVAIATWWQLRARHLPAPAAPPAKTAGLRAGAPPADRGEDTSTVQQRLPRHPQALSLTAGGFVAIVSAAIAPGARLGVDWRQRTFPLAMRLGLSGTTGFDEPLAVGRVRYRRFAAEAGLVWIHGPLQIDGMGMVGRLLVDGTGYASNADSGGYSWGLGLGARLCKRMGRTTLWAEARGIAWPQAQRIFVTDTATSQRSYRELSHAELQLGMGLSFQLF